VDTEAIDEVRSVRVTPRKLGLVAVLIRGNRVEAALSELTFSKRRIAKDVRKVLQSAIANAENNHQLDVDRLVVAEASVGKGLVMRRFHARARGRRSEERRVGKECRSRWLPDHATARSLTQRACLFA